MLRIEVMAKVKPELINPIFDIPAQGTPLADPRQERFCLYVATDKPLGVAAELAGYKKSSAGCSATALRKLPAIQRRIAELQKGIQSSLIMDATQRRVKLSQIARAELTQFLDEDGQPVLRRNTPNAGAVSEYGVKDTKYGVVRTIRLINPIEAISELNKMDHVYEGNININVGIQIKEVEVRLSGIVPPAEVLEIGSSDTG